MKRPNLPTGEWNYSKHGTPEGCPQFGIYADGAPNDFAIVKAEEPVAQAVAALPDLLAALEDTYSALKVLWAVHAKGAQSDTLDAAKAALTKAGYTF